jgi:hypothetical protein
MTQEYFLGENGWQELINSIDLLPPPEYVKSFAHGAMERFNEAVQRKSFTEFYKQVSERWKKDVTVRQMDNAFRAFWEKKAVLVPLADIVVLQQPKLIAEEVFSINGYMDIKEYRAWFDMKLVYENAEWKLFGIDVVVKKPDTDPPNFVKKDE